MFVLGWFAFLYWILGEDEKSRCRGIRKGPEPDKPPVFIKSGPPPKLPPRAPRKQIVPKEKPEGSTESTEKAVKRIEE